MIDFAGLVGKITGKTAMAGPGGSAEPGVATGGEFAALVQLAAQAGLEDGQPKLKLVVDNSIAPDASDAAIAAMLSSLTGETLETDSSTAKGESPSGSEEGDGQTDQGPKGQDSGPFNIATPIIAAWSAVPTPAPLTVGKISAGGGAVDAVTVQQAGVAPVTEAGDQPATPAIAIATVQGPVQSTPDATAQQVETTNGHPVAAMHAQLAEALRALAPRGRHAERVEKADAALQIGAAAVFAAGGDGEPTTDLGIKSASVSAVRGSDATVLAAPSPLRAIVEGVPPATQSELGAPSIRAVTGPSTGDALGDQVIDMGVSGQWIDRMAREISSLADGSGHSRFTLNPPHLGKLTVDLWQDAGATNVRLLTETDEAAQRLAEGRPALQADARIAALGLGSITVEKSSASADSSPRDQGNAARQGGDFSGQMNQQQAEGQAQSRAGGARASDWVSRSLRDDDIQTHDAAARAPDRAANGRVRFA